MLRLTCVFLGFDSISHCLNKNNVSILPAKERPILNFWTPWILAQENGKMEKSFDCWPLTSMNILTVIICREQCAQLAGSTMWTSDSSHTCPSPQTNAMPMMPGVMATACCLKDILLWWCLWRPQSEQTWLHGKVAFHFRAQSSWHTRGNNIVCNNTHWLLHTETIWGQMPAVFETVGQVVSPANK